MNIVTIMNFIRGVEPRNPNLDLLEPVKRQMELNEKYGFDNTFLLQYDALINPAFSELFTKAPDSRREIGVWIEIVRPLTEKVGIKWRGRPGYDWDVYQRREKAAYRRAYGKIPRDLRRIPKNRRFMAS